MGEAFRGRCVASPLSRLTWPSHLDPGIHDPVWNGGTFPLHASKASLRAFPSLSRLRKGISLSGRSWKTQPWRIASPARLPANRLWLYSPEGYAASLCDVNPQLPVIAPHNSWGPVNLISNATTVVQLDMGSRSTHRSRDEDLDTA